MHRLTLLTRGLLTLGLVLTAGGASAHVGYGSALYSAADVYDPIANNIGTGTYGAAGNFTATAASNAGFLAGLDPATLGNTHDIRFRYFTLAETSQVSFTIVGLPNSPVSGNPNTYLNGLTASTLNPAFSLYSGLVPASSHEGVGDVVPNVSGYIPIAAYLANAPEFASWSPFAGVNALRGGDAAGSPGNPTGLWGVFDSNGDWTTGNNGQFTASNTAFSDPAPADGIGPYLGNLGVPKVGTVHYLGISGADAAYGSTFVDSLGNAQAVIGADGVVDNSVSWTGILGPGIYTLGIGGASLLDYANLAADVRNSLGGLDTSTMCGSTTCANLYAADRLARNLSISGFSVAVVPLPGSVWLLGTALTGAGILGRRRRGSTRATVAN